MIVVRVFGSYSCLLSVKDMSKCKSILDYFKFNSESEILDGPENHDQSEPSVSGPTSYWCILRVPICRG